jgi:hypothetical protein
MSKTFYKTKISFHVLSQEPIPDDMDIDTIYQECIDGEYSGDLEYEKEVSKLTGKQAAQELINQGSDPSFFQLDEKGKSTPW